MVLTASALSPLVQSANAQAAPLVATSLTLDVQEPNGPPLGIMVPGRPYALEVKVNYQYDPGALQPAGPTRIDLELVEAPSWMQAKLNPVTVYVAVNTSTAISGSTATNVTYIEANLTLDAPAYELANVSVRARAQSNGNLAPSEGGDAQAFRPGFIPQMRIVTSTSPAAARGGVPASIPIRFENTGNGPLLVNLTLLGSPQGARVTVPAPFVLGATATGGSGKHLLQLDVLTPWSATTRGDVDLRADFWHVERTEIAGEPISFRVSIEGQSPVPGAEVAVAAGAVALSSFLVRRRD